MKNEGKNVVKFSWITLFKVLHKKNIIFRSFFYIILFYTLSLLCTFLKEEESDEKIEEEKSGKEKKDLTKVLF